MEAIAEAAAVAAWPLALTVACAAAVDRRRQSRRREALNRALHELRRPLHALSLARPSADRGGRLDQLDLALAAIDDLDAAINGARSPGIRQPVPAGPLLLDAASRWRSPAKLLGRRLEVRPPEGDPVVRADPGAIARALDNLIANSLEHGAARILITGRCRAGSVRIAVADGAIPGVGAALAGPLVTGPAGRADPRRGYGLDVVAGVAADHGGRFALHRGERGALAVLELPLVSGGAREPPG